MKVQPPEYKQNRTTIAPNNNIYSPCLYMYTMSGECPVKLCVGRKKRGGAYNFCHWRRVHVYNVSELSILGMPCVCTFLEQYLDVCAPNLWNCLPVSIRRCGHDNDTVKYFQSLIKTHLNVHLTCEIWCDSWRCIFDFKNHSGLNSMLLF